MRLSLRIGLGVTVIVLVVNLFAFGRIERQTGALLEGALLDVARTLHHEIVVVRAWAAHYGGVYIPKGEGVTGNPYLENNLVVTEGGDTLVLRNPAMITRELAALGDSDELRFSFRITSLDPMNPDNAPDEFETRALRRLDAGSAGTEVTEVEDGPAGPQFRYVAPLVTQSACLNCHAAQGYALGDVRGGLSINIAMQSVVEAQRAQSVRTALSYLLISGLIAGLVYVFMQRTVVRPLRRLEGVADRIGRGDYTAPLGPNRSDEIGDLTQALGRMRDQIQTTTETQIESEKLFALGQVAAGIAHDIRNPLFAVRNNVDYLRRRETAHEDDEVLGEIDDGLDRIDRIVGEVNEFAKPHAVEFGLHRLDEIIAGCMVLLGKQIEKQALEFEIELAEGLPSVEMDRHRMEQVLINIVSNAITATKDAAPGRIRVQGREAAGGVELIISDNGHGIREANLPHIFDPFFTRSPQGTGLGLSIVKRLLLQHHGRIDVRSGLGQGATFTLWLPLRQPRADED